MSVVGALLILLGAGALVTATLGDRSNEKTFADQIAALDGAQPPQSSVVGTAVDRLATAMRRFLDASRTATRASNRIAHLFDRSVKMAEAGDMGGGQSRMRSGAGAVIERYDRALRAQARADRALVRAVAGMKEVLR